MKIRPVASQGTCGHRSDVCTMALHVPAPSLLELMALCLASVTGSVNTDGSDKDG